MSIGATILRFESSSVIPHLSVDDYIRAIDHRGSTFRISADRTARSQLARYPHVTQIPAPRRSLHRKLILKVARNQAPAKLSGTFGALNW